MADHKFGGDALIFDQKLDMVLEVGVYGTFSGSCRDPAAVGEAIIGALTEVAEDGSSAAMMVMQADAWKMAAADNIAEALAGLGASGSVTELNATLSDKTRTLMRAKMGG